MVEKMRGGRGFYSSKSRTDRLCFDKYRFWRKKAGRHMVKCERFIAQRARKQAMRVGYGSLEEEQAHSTISGFLGSFEEKKFVC